MLRKIFFLSLILVLYGCSDLSVDYSGYGTLDIQVNLSDTRTISPSVPTTIDYVLITGIGPDNTSFSQEILPYENYLSGYLIPGVWTVTVYALGYDGNVVAAGEDQITVVSGTVSQTTIVVSNTVGEGVLELNLSWNINITSPVIYAELEDADGYVYPVYFTVSGNSASYTGSFTSGFYTLYVQLLDGSAWVWGKTSAVFIADDTTASWSHTLE